MFAMHKSKPNCLKFPLQNNYHSRGIFWLHLWKDFGKRAAWVPAIFVLLNVSKETNGFFADRKLLLGTASGLLDVL